MQKFISEHPMLFSGIVALLLIAASVLGLHLGLMYSAQALENAPKTVQESAVYLEPAATPSASDNNYKQYAKFDWSTNPLQLPSLTKEEQARCADLLTRYAQGERPKASAPNDPAQTGFAVVPLAPEAYDGLAQYVFLPGRALSDEELMQLIAYYALKGNTFDPYLLNETNCMRGGCVEVNRARTAEEGERLNSLQERYKREGLRPSCTPSMDAASGSIVTVMLNEKEHAGLNSFTFYPLRRLTDEELLELIDRNLQNSLYNQEGFEVDWEGDEATCRAIAKRLFDMEESADLTQDGYTRGDAMRPDLYTAFFEAVQQDGARRLYVVSIDRSTGLLYSAITVPPDSSPQPTSAPGISAPNIPTESAPLPEPDLNDPEWTEAVRAFAVQRYLAPENQIISARAYATCSYNAGDGVSVALDLSDGASITLGVLQDSMEICSVNYYRDGFDVDAYLRSIG
jgi:hypothetical protein